MNGPVVTISPTVALSFLGSTGTDVSSVIGNVQRAAVAVIAASPPNAPIEASDIAAACSAVAGVAEVRSCTFEDGSSSFTGADNMAYEPLPSSIRVDDVRIVP